MPATPKNLRTCVNGHRYQKSSDCPICPFCAAQDKPEEGFLATLGAPARRALENSGIDTVQKLSQHSEADILKLHGMGPGSLPKLRQALHEFGLSFK